MSLFNAEHFSQAVPLSFNTNVTDGAIMIVMDCKRLTIAHSVYDSQDKGSTFLYPVTFRHRIKECTS